jgi:DEAD/DEAH box helicase domain-containing protein
MSLKSLLGALRLDPDFMSSVSAWENQPAREALFAPTPESLHPSLSQMLQSLGIAGLYKHQTQAINSIFDGNHTALITATSSGKSLAYHIPALHFALSQPGARALYIFPTKALAQDQAAMLETLKQYLPGGENIQVAIYDGDTPQNRRAAIRKSATIVLTNPDMLHTGILPAHTGWADFFTNLQLIVLDEYHTYRGVFGSHVANVIRRLKRISRFYGSSPLFIGTSATISNAQEHLENLIEAPVAPILEDTSAKYLKHIILINPYSPLRPLSDAGNLYTNIITLSRHLLSAHSQTILFTRSRFSTEILLDQLLALARQLQLPSPAIRGYRSGYLATERREIEQGLREGSVRMVVSTNALELGIDIGSMDVVLVSGYPSSIASLWQQFGRAGRRGTESAGILLASADPLDQYIITHPRFIFEGTPERALINANNLKILINHIRCAAFELPFTTEEAYGNFEDLTDLMTLLEESGELHLSQQGYHWIADARPAATFSLRTSTSDTIVIQTHETTGVRVIGEFDRDSAPMMIYAGAIYLHEGRQYQVDSLDWEQGIADVSPVDVDFYTESGLSTSIQIEEIYGSRETAETQSGHGRAILTIQSAGYRIVKRYSLDVLGYGDIDLPARQFETTAFWMSIQPETAQKLAEQGILMLPNQYGPNWPEQRDRARARDSYRCTRCNAPERPDKQHDVHHLRPFRDFAYRPGHNQAYLQANQLDNLRTLCHRCHMLIEGFENRRSALGGAATVLHHIAPLFLMCSSHDLQVIADYRVAYAPGPTLTFYETGAGGVGLTEQLFDLRDSLLKAAIQLVADCTCQSGCPACIGPTSIDTDQIKQDTITLLTLLSQ